MKEYKILPYIVAAIMAVAILALRIYCAQSEILKKAENDISNGTAIVVNEETNPESLSTLFTSREYLAAEEAAFISEQLMNLINSEAGKPYSIRDLGDKKYGIELDSVGFEKIANYPYLSSRAQHLAGGQDVDSCKRPDSREPESKKFLVKIRNKKRGSHRDSVYLCVREHYNELVESNGKIIDCYSRDSIYAWIPVCGKTDIYLPVKDKKGSEERYFSVVPVEKGFVYGNAQGTYNNHRRVFKFVRTKAVLPLFGKGMLKRMRDDNSILVRSPKEYRDKYISAIALFGILWMSAYMLLSIIDKKRKGNSNLEILVIVILLSGVGMVNLFNLQNPLWGEMFAWSQLLKGIALGIGILIVFAFIDWTNLYRFSYNLQLTTGKRRTPGIWMALCAIILALILLLFGHGPGGTRVTLPVFSIQGSPLIKLLFIGYLAVVFASRSDLLEAYTRPGKLWKQIVVIATSILALSILGVLQLMISDLGPFLVIVITSIIIFSLITKETISMLIGTAIFSTTIIVCNNLSPHTYLPFAIFAVFTVAWSCYCYVRHERIKLSPIVLSLVILLAFHGGTLFNIVGMHDIAERLNGRTEIAINTFDNEVIGGSQIAEGIWAVARGGLFGNPEACLSQNLPAGHTDLAFVSICENMGILGGVLVILVMGVLLYTALKIGIRNGHPFGFGLASLIALSIGVQSLLIILGSIGIIPLTGVTLNFLSYGGTAMIVDLASIGILISLSRHKDYQLEVNNTQRYEPMSRGQLWAYIFWGFVALAVVINYGFISRNDYLIRPGKFINNKGERITIVNPLISSIEKRVIPGDILDRNGKVMATTVDGGERYYPYGDYALMVIGDLNTKVLWGTAGKRPAGLLAEERYQSKIRGYDTKPLTIPIKSSRHYSRYLPDVIFEKNETVRIEDYSALIPMMKSEKRLKEWNEQKEKRDISLTIDAELQKALSESAADFVQRKQGERKTDARTRASIVVMDAADGSLLTSAMYPLPDQRILRELAMTNTTIYRDWYRSFIAYSDMDLCLVPHAPGSTVKPLSAGAGIKRFSTSLGTDVYNQNVLSAEVVDITLGEPVGDVSLESALVQSSNVYFIKLINQYGSKGLYPELASLYYAVGAGFGSAVPYVLYPHEVITSKESYTSQVESFGVRARQKYAEYEESMTPHRLIDSEYQPSWGQGELTMTPISLCRFVATVANDGKMMYPRYEGSDSVYVYEEMFSADEARLLQNCMKKQAAGRFGEYSINIGGKTGTPTRTDKAKPSGKSNDALYCFFIEGEATISGSPLAVVVRLERVNDYSRLAIAMANEVVIPVLKEKGYIN